MMREIFECVCQYIGHIVIVCTIGYIIYYITDKIVLSIKNRRKNIAELKKKYIMKYIEEILDKDIEHYDFMNIEYRFCTLGKHNQSWTDGLDFIVLPDKPYPFDVRDYHITDNKEDCE